MKITAVLVFLMFFQAPTDKPAGPITLPTGGVVCDGSETPCNPDKPWMRGTVEKWCGRTPEQVKGMQEKNPGAVIMVCDCAHMCNPKDEFAAENGGVTWDGKCQARCNPKACECPRKCDSH